MNILIDTREYAEGPSSASSFSLESLKSIIWSQCLLQTAVDSRMHESIGYEVVSGLEYEHGAWVVLYDSIQKRDIGIEYA